MINIRNLKIVKEKLVPLALAGTLALSLTGCTGEIDLSNVSITDIMSNQSIKDVTLIDELIENNMLQSVDDQSIVDAANQLEKYINVCEELERAQLENVDNLRPLSEQDKEVAARLSEDAIRKLIEIAKKKPTTLKEMEDKVIAQKELNYIYNLYKDWINKNGKTISIDIMIAAVKASIADELEISPDDYYKIIIPPSRGSTEDGPGDRYIQVDEKYYRIPRSSSEIISTIDYIYAVQIYNPDDATRYATYKKAINYAKTTISAGANLKDDKLESQYSKKYIEENFGKK